MASFAENTPGITLLDRATLRAVVLVFLHGVAAGSEPDEPVPRIIGAVQRLRRVGRLRDSRHVAGAVENRSYPRRASGFRNVGNLVHAIGCADLVEVPSSVAIGVFQ